MSSPQGLRFEPSTTTTPATSANNTTSIPSTTTTTTTTTAPAAHTTLLPPPPPPPPPPTTSILPPHPPNASPTPLQHQQQQYLTSAAPLLPPLPARLTSPAKPFSDPPSRATGDEDNISEAETVVLGSSDDDARLSGQELSLEDGVSNKREWTKTKEKTTMGKERGNDRQRGRERRDEESPRKKRKRSPSRSIVREGNTSNERRSSGENVRDEDTEGTSDLSSTYSSRQVSPMRQRVSPRERPRNKPEGRPERSRSFPRLNSYRTGHKNTRKRKAPADSNSTTSDDEVPEPEPRPRQRRGSALEASPHTRKHSIRSSSPLPPHPRLSPTRITKARALPAGSKKRKAPPPPLTTSRENHLDEEDDGEDNDSSSSLSRHSSPARHRRLHSATARTPGSPISMSHKPKRDTAGRTHLHRACGRGATTDVEAILEQSNDLINAEDNAGYMPIHEASLHGFLDIVKLLVKYGSHLDTQSRIDLESPLLDAVENGHVPVVEYLLELGADPRKRDRQGRSCLDANREGTETAPGVREGIEKLLKKAIKQRPAQRTSDDENNRASVPADRDSPSSRDPSVVSPAHHSPPAPTQNTRRRNARAEQSRKDLLWLDSGKGSVVKLREKAREGDFQMVHALLETGLKPDTEALVGAIKGGHTELVSLLLAYGAEVDPVPGQTDKEGGRRKRDVSMPIGEETPMLAAIGRGNLDILRYLLQNERLDARRKDSKGRTYPEIAREREGDLWHEEVELLEEAWQKAGGGAVEGNGSPIETKSPSHHKSSPKPRSSTKHLRRGSSSSPSRTQSRPPTKRMSDEKVSKRSVSANSLHRLSDLQAASDRESAEPLGPPKNRQGGPKRSESESLAPGIAKKRRRLVSGKVRDQEAARGSDPDSGKKLDRSSEKPVIKAVQSDMEDTIRVDLNLPSMLKTEPLEDVKMEDAPPLKPQPKVRATGERQASAVRSDSTAQETKRPVSRTRSPPKAPRSDIERRQEQEQLRRRRKEEHPDDRYPRRRDSIAEEPRRLREGRNPEHPRPTSVSSEPGRRAIRDEPDKVRQAEERWRIRGEREKDDRDLKERRENKLRDEKLAKEKKVRDLGEPISQEQISREAREILRKKHLTKELASIQKKALKDSEDRRADEVITRELELRRLRGEEERRQRIIREREEQEQEEKEAREKIEREAHEKEAKEKEELERAIKAKEERERLEKEARERDIREKEEAVRVARGKAEHENREREKKEREEREAKELEARLQEEQQREAERQLEEERRRQEHERQTKLAADLEERRKLEEAEKHRLEQEHLEKKLRAEEADKKRKAIEEENKRRELEKEKAEKDARDKKVAEELQQQIAQEQEARRVEEVKEAIRIQSLPYTLRIAAEHQSQGLAPEHYRHFVPLFAATFTAVVHPAPGTSTFNGVIRRQEKWVLNIQVALALGTSDLALDGFALMDRRPVTEHERFRMWSVLAPMLCENFGYFTSKSMEERAAIKLVEKTKFQRMQPVFWLKFDDVLSIISFDSRYKDLFQHPLTAVDVTMDVPTCGKGSPRSGSVSTPPSREELTARINRRFSTHPSSPPSESRDSSFDSNSHSKSMPPPTFGISNSSG